MEVGIKGFIIILVTIGAFLIVGLGLGVSHLASVGMLKIRGAEVKIGEVVVQAELARTITERARGLSGRTSLGDYGGMLFVTETPERQVFWMKGMKIPIDIIWIRGGIVVGIEPNVEPSSSETSNFELPRLRSPGLVDMVLEVPSGFSKRHMIQPGDAVVITGI